MGTMRPIKYDVVIAGAICNRDQVHLFSQCANKFVRITHDGKVLANDGSLNPQTVLISNHVPQGIFWGPLKLTLFIEEAQMYLCFNKRWRLVSSKKLQEYCYFYETMVNGWHRFHSATDDTKHIGFTRNGRAIRFLNRTTRPYENCYNFAKIDRSNINLTTDEPTAAAAVLVSTKFDVILSSTITTPTSLHGGYATTQHQQKSQPHHHQQQHHHQKPSATSTSIKSSPLIPKRHSISNTNTNNNNKNLNINNNYSNNSNNNSNNRSSSSKAKMYPNFNDTNMNSSTISSSSNSNTSAAGTSAIPTNHRHRHDHSQRDQQSHHPKQTKNTNHRHVIATHTDQTLHTPQQSNATMPRKKHSTSNQKKLTLRKQLHQNHQQNRQKTVQTNQEDSPPSQSKQLTSNAAAAARSSVISSTHLQRQNHNVNVKQNHIRHIIENDATTTIRTIAIETTPRSTPTTTASSPPNLFDQQPQHHHIRHHHNQPHQNQHQQLHMYRPSTSSPPQSPQLDEILRAKNVEYVKSPSKTFHFDDYANDDYHNKWSDYTSTATKKNAMQHNTKPKVTDHHHHNRNSHSHNHNLNHHHSSGSSSISSLETAKVRHRAHGRSARRKNHLLNNQSYATFST